MVASSGFSHAIGPSTASVDLNSFIATSIVAFNFVQTLFSRYCPASLQACKCWLPQLHVIPSELKLITMLPFSTMVGIYAFLSGAAAAAVGTATTSTTVAPDPNFTPPPPDACASVSSYIQEASAANPTVSFDYPYGQFLLCHLIDCLQS